LEKSKSNITYPNANERIPAKTATLRPEQRMVMISNCLLTQDRSCGLEKAK